MRLILLLLPVCLAGSLRGQELHSSWPSSMIVGSLWRTGAGIGMTDTGYVEPGLRSLVPSIALEDLRFSRHPHAREIATGLAEAIGLLDRPEHPSSPPITTDSLIALLDSSDPGTIGAEAYLRIRYFDLLVGDWSRNASDFLWYRNDDTTGAVWIPLPTPYVNAFTRYDGLMPWAVVQASDYMTSWSDDPLSSIRRQSPLRSLDRRFLSPEQWTLWEKAADWLAARLTQERIDGICDRFSGPGIDLIRTGLIRRTESLQELARQYYRELSRFVEFRDFGERDSIFIKVRSREALEVRTAGQDGDVRLLNGVATQEVRLLLMEHANPVWVEGPGNISFSLIVDVGTKTAQIYYRRNALQSWTAGTPASVQLFHTSPADRAAKPDDAWGTRTVFVPWIDANKDDHLFLGGGPEITTSAYTADPYATRTTLLAGIATRTGRYRLSASYETRILARGTSFGFEADYSQLNISNFFGIGNETSSPKELLTRSYFKVDQRTFDVNLPFRFLLSDDASVGLTPSLRIIRTDPRPGSLIDSLVSAGSTGRMNYSNLSLDALYDSRDRSVIPTKGMYISARGTWFPASLQNPSPFASLRLDSRYYVYLHRNGSHLLLRTLGEVVWGDHPWFESAFLGGTGSLRGYERQRFAGDAILSGALEARIPFGRVQLLWPFDVGGLAFVEAGRAFVRGESSHLWHASSGGGVWLRPERSPYTLVLSVAASPELVEILATFGLPVRD